MTVLVFFPDPVSLEILAEIYEQNKLENVTIFLNKFYILSSIGKSISLALHGIYNLA